MRLLSLILFTVSFPALYCQQLKIQSGVVDHQVLQRGPNRLADFALAGDATNLDGKTIEFRYTPGGHWTKSGKIEAGKWTANFQKIPEGGPYSLEVRAGSATASVKDVLVGDLWILAGQSNMEGVGDLVDVQQPDPRVHSFDQADTWALATEPLHSLPDAVDPIHWRRNSNNIPERLQGEALAKYRENRKKGAGLGLPFAVQMVKSTGVPIGLVPCAHGGTSMAQWDPALKGKGWESLYGSMLRRFQAVGGHVAGVLWYQGESDANPQAAPVFGEKFEQLVAAVRSDFGEPDLPFYYAQIGRFVNDENQAEWNQIQEAQRLAEAKIRNSGLVASIDAELDDVIHVSTQDQKRLGARFANLAAQSAKRGPRLGSLQLDGNSLHITFTDVNGSLHAMGRVSGFSIHSAEGKDLPFIFKANVDPANGSAIIVHLIGKLPPGAALQYGAGKDPYCNVRDAADMALPVFGPVPLVAADVSASSPERIVATVNGRPYTASEMDALVHSYPPKVAADPENFLRTYAAVQGLVNAARKRGADQTAPLKQQIDQMLMTYELENSEILVMPDEQKKYFDEHPDEFKGSTYEQVRDAIFQKLRLAKQTRLLEAKRAQATVTINDPAYFEKYKNAQ